MRHVIHHQGKAFFVDDVTDPSELPANPEQQRWQRRFAIFDGNRPVGSARCSLTGDARDNVEKLTPGLSDAVRSDAALAFYLERLPRQFAEILRTPAETIAIVNWNESESVGHIAALARGTASAR